MLNRNMRKYISPIVSITLMALALVSCATATNFDAADDIRNFAIALRDRNYPVIESHIDKRALKAQAMMIARDIAIQEGAKRLGTGLGAQVASIAAVDALKPVIEALADRALEPDALAYFVHQAGVDQSIQVPSRYRTTIALKYLEDGRVCVPDDKTKRCMLYFAKYDNVWKLNGVDEQSLKAIINK